MSLPSININVNNTIHAYPEDGSLIYNYSPFQNLKISGSGGTTDLTALSLSSKSAGININNPITMDSEVSYDDSVNLLINDHTNPLKLINSRFYLVDATTYKIADRRGNLDTNIYTEENFKTEAGLIKVVRSIVKLDFLGIFDGGRMPVGNYNFYFKLADSDGNESDFICESGKVVCHIGGIDQPTSIRGGLLNENSDKLIKFQLDNLDLAYDYINVYYTRNSGAADSETIETFRIVDKFRINGLSTEVSITGYEEHISIDSSEINIQYTTFDSAQTGANCQNITFAGNISKDHDVFRTLEKHSLLITPQLSNVDENGDPIGIGNLNHKYTENFPDEGYEYYNANNVYYKLGYWDEDIYRFGIVYIMNDYTLSPVFSIRGVKELNSSTSFYPYAPADTISYGDDFLLEKSFSEDNPENAKGVFKINSSDPIFNGNSSVQPIGIKFNFPTIGPLSGTPQFEDITKGFFIVRQKRIPTILTQGISIATSTKAFTPTIKGTYGEGFPAYFGESFLVEDDEKPKLGRGFFEITDYKNNALLCPEANLRTPLFNNFFNSSEFALKEAKYYSAGAFSDISTNGDRNIFTLGNLYPASDTETFINTDLLLVEPGIELINNGEGTFSSKSGDETEAWRHSDPVLGSLEDLRSDPDADAEEWSKTTSKVRGEFNSYVGCKYDSLKFGQHYNIFQKDYDFGSRWKNYFRVRYNDSSSFMAVSDRTSWEDLNNNATKTLYRGDCYINTYSHRVLWNFIDPELPTNTSIVDPWTWFKNYRIKTTEVIIGSGDLGDQVIMDNSDDALSGSGSSTYFYKKVLDLFTYRSTDINTEIETSDGTDISLYRLALPDSKKFKKYSDANGTFGASKINRPDVNAVPIGHWATFKVCSNINLAMRDLDPSLPAEEATHRRKRGFYPIQDAVPTAKLPESTVINSGISKSLSDRYYYEVPDTPFIKSSFSTRIHYSDILQESSFKNGNRVFKAVNYQDYTIEYGALVKLVEWFGTLIAVMERGVLMIPVNERALMTNASGENVYINTDNVLPKNPKILSNTFGSIWAESVVKTPRYIYGIDTVGKKVWRTNGETFQTISDIKIQKFLNDNINLKDTDKKKNVGEYIIKTHYNAFKQDVMFVFNYEEFKWHLCWNELLEKWVTRYSWFPEFSENINNIFYTFANSSNHLGKESTLYKHGFAGNEEQLGEILPTKWYDEQEPFEFEFVVIGVQGVQKIFDNLKIVSNLAEPDSFYYEIVGEGFEWQIYKDILAWMPTYLTPDPGEEGSYTEASLNAMYTYLLSNPLITIKTAYPDFPFEEEDSFRFKKLPYLLGLLKSNFVYDRAASVLKDLSIEEHNKTKEKLVEIYQKGHDIKRNGRLRGNMRYVEDSWDVQIQPISFKYAYLKNGAVAYSRASEMKIRDKYIKIRVKYDGTRYAIINALKTFFTISHA